MRVHIIGGGLAGSEAAWQCAKAGQEVTLQEMRPRESTPAHRTGLLAELVCSNSLKSKALDSASGLLKEELRRLGSLIMRVAEESSLPAGSSLAVDRHLFSSMITKALEEDPHILILREEAKDIPCGGLTILASGPLTSPPLIEALSSLIEETAADSPPRGKGLLSFFDALSPIIMAESIDFSKVFRASRYQQGEGDYLNAPLNAEEYERFWAQLTHAEVMEARNIDIPFFEGCLPIEELAIRGKDALRFGPLKPVGLVDPSTGRRPWAVVQLRQENKEATMYNLVGFQTRLKWGEQRRIFRQIPGLEAAEFCRHGSIHRNTFINSPILLSPNLQWKGRSDLLLAGQMIGVEGYMESAAMGLLAGINAVGLAKGKPLEVPPIETALGSLVRYITEADPNFFQPMGINFGLFPPLDKQRGVTFKERRMRYAQRSLSALESWIAHHAP